MSISIVEIDKCKSTNDEAWKFLSKEKSTLVLAKKQLQGRGSQGRPWVHEDDGNLAVSLVMPPIDMKDFFLPNLTLAAGVAAIDALKLTLPVLTKNFDLRDLGFKWPNDLFFKGKKLGGILSESRMNGEICSGIVVGMGLNITKSPDIDGVETASLYQNVLPHVDNVDERLNAAFKWFFAYNWAEELQSWISVLKGGGLAQLQKEWERYSITRKQ